MNLLVIAGQSPYPPVSGGKKDVYTKLGHLIGLGNSVHLMVVDYESNRWQGEPWKADGQALASAHFFSRTQNVWSFFSYLPVQVVSRKVAKIELMLLVKSLKKSQVEAIVCEGVFCMRLAHRIAQELKVPVCLRSHNDERAFFSQLARSEKSWIKKIPLMAESFKAGLFEKHVTTMSHLKMVLSIEPETKSTWQQVNKKIDCRFLPACCDEGKATMPLLVPDNAHLLFIGSLNMKPNVEGLQWFIHKIWPAVLEQVPLCRLRVVGSGAGNDVREFLENTPSCDVVLDQPDISSEYDAGAIFINPTRFGAGISIKTVEAMRYGLPIVSTFSGARACALTNNVDSFLVDNDDAIAFTSAVIRVLKSNSVRKNMSHAVISTYTRIFSEENTLEILRVALDSLNSFNAKHSGTLPR